mmetsp:Transcript_114880/g.321039  ORF Transcript_114880/g.321039 Transcript_114880/m.321039 type:complete len:400 (+) Transcript_114880:224-1423(+)
MAERWRLSSRKSTLRSADADCDAALWQRGGRPQVSAAFPQHVQDLATGRVPHRSHLRLRWPLCATTCRDEVALRSHNQALDLAAAAERSQGLVQRRAPDRCVCRIVGDETVRHRHRDDAGDGTRAQHPELARAQVPCESPMAVASHHLGPALDEDGGLDVAAPVRSYELPLLLARRSAPQGNGVVVEEQERLAVLRDLHGARVGPPGPQRVQRRTGGGVPDDSSERLRSSSSAGDDPVARREDPNAAVMACGGEAVQDAAAGGVPDERGAVVANGNDALAVGENLDFEHLLHDLVARELYQGLPGLAVPNDDSPVVPRCRHAATPWEGLDIGDDDMAAKDERRLAVLDPPHNRQVPAAGRHNAKVLHEEIRDPVDDILDQVGSQQALCGLGHIRRHPKF